MPTRFMLLYGADDAKLRHIDDHPDRFEGENHKINVANLRFALKRMGYDVKASGPFDGSLLSAFLEYLKGFTPINWYDVAESGVMSSTKLMKNYGLPSWRYFDRCGCYIDGKNVDHDRVRKELSPDYGDKLVAEAGGAPKFDKSRTCYRYPWVAFQMTTNFDQEKYRDREIDYEIFDSESGELFARGKIRRPFTVQTLLPDSEAIDVFIDGHKMMMH